MNRAETNTIRYTFEFQLSFGQNIYFCCTLYMFWYQIINEVRPFIKYCMVPMRRLGTWAHMHEQSYMSKCTYIPCQ